MKRFKRMTIGSIKLALLAMCFLFGCVSCQSFSNPGSFDRAKRIVELGGYFDQGRAGYYRPSYFQDNQDPAIELVRVLAAPPKASDVASQK